MRTEEENPLKSIQAAIAFSPRDWSAYHRDAWIWGIVFGWDEESMIELTKRHGWTNTTVKRLNKKYLKLLNKSEV